MGKKWLKRIAVSALASFILLSGIPVAIVHAAQSTETEAVEEFVEENPDFTLDERQKNSIAMLNYLTVLTQDINDAKNNRMYMEEVYNSLISNTYPNAVDQRTQTQLTSLLDTLEGYRMVDVKRERLDYIYEQNKAMAIISVVPHPIEIHALATAVKPAQLLRTCVFTAANAAASYAEARYEADMKYLQDGWALDDEQAETLHNSRKDAFLYMLDIVRDNDLPGNLALSEDNVKEFVKWKNNDNVKSRIKYMESNEDTYKAFGDYWLLLVRSYYENGDYKKCLDALSGYKDLDVCIFRKDTSLAQTLPYAVTAADLLYEKNQYGNKDEYVDQQEQYLSMLIDNTDYDDWSLRYFAAQEYCRLFNVTGSQNDLQKAYNLVYDNVNALVKDQRDENAEYLSKIKEKKAPNGASKETKKDIAQYNKMIKAERKKALAPVNEALKLNCELLFALSDELKISALDKADIDGILHNNNEPLFLAKALDDQFWFNRPKTEDDYSASFDKTKIELPVSIVTDGSAIKVTISEGGEKSTYDDWELSEVKRDKTNSFENFTAVYTSKAAKKHKYTEDSKVEAEIIPEAGIDADPEKLLFNVVTKKKIGFVKDYQFEQVK